ncbi:hypothetical protein GCM10023115_18220 [Pontixanthobacter gangjinensis]|uniref:Uncharacterized protein n=1 Tax=Pontixanthobacter gangjinensis TaxID=1028742 RepID=A0A6I4SPJ8_9SPHN|nr:hypothetical protein [Pontixanthobacter gangjinensis]MXO57070.1 hypothetical protein [Pontixanthobacter gangjinensis]
MSDSLEIRFKEDRALRNASLALVKADLAYLKLDLTAKSIGGRVADRLTEGAVDVFEEATQAADDNKGVLITLIAAVGVWFARNPILSLFNDGLDQSEDIETETIPGEDPQQV